MTKPTLYVTGEGTLCINYPEGDVVEVGSMSDPDVSFDVPEWATKEFETIEAKWRDEHSEEATERAREWYQDQAYDRSGNR